jgi:hypothetical protein
MNYKVGQVLYLTNNKSLRIIPVQIIEEVIRTTLNGQEKTYMIQFPDQEKTIADIQSLKSGLYEDISILKKIMLENATKSIDKMILSTKKLVEISFNAKALECITDDKITKKVQANKSNDIITVDLGNGVKAKMKTNELEKVTN